MTFVACSWPEGPWAHPLWGVSVPPHPQWGAPVLLWTPAGKSLCKRNNLLIVKTVVLVTLCVHCINIIYYRCLVIRISLKGWSQELGMLLHAGCWKIWRGPEVDFEHPFSLWQTVDGSVAVVWASSHSLVLLFCLYYVFLFRSLIRVSWLETSWDRL